MQSKYQRSLLAVLALATMLGGGLGRAAEVDELQQRFTAALGAIEANRLRSARDMLRSLLAENPSLLRARLELARVYYLTADFDAARAEAEQVLADPELPPQVRVTVLAFLAQVTADQQRVEVRSRWSGSIALGLMYDSNVNFGPSRDIIDIGGTLFGVTPEASDFALVVAPGLAHSWDPQRRFEWGEHTGVFLWQTQASGYYRAYLDETDFNLGVLTLRTGPAWIVPQRWRASLALQGDQVWLDDRRLAWFSSLNPSLTMNIAPATELTIDLIASRRHYQESSERERRGWYQGGGVTVEHQLREGQIALQAGLGWYWFNASASRFSFRSPDAFAGVAARAWQNGTVYGRVGYRGYSFRGPEPLFNERRDEDEWRMVLGFQHEFAEGALRRWALQGSWAWTSNNSNVAIYDYDRHQLNLGLAREF